MSNAENNTVNETAPATGPVIEAKAKTSKKSRKAVAKVKRGRGRPPVYGKADIISILSAVKKAGNLKHACVALQARFPKISVPTVAKLAKANGLSFNRGRPKVKPVKVAKAKAVKAEKPAQEQVA